MSLAQTHLCGHSLEKWQKAFDHKEILFDGKPIGETPLPKELSAMIASGRIGGKWRYDGINGLHQTSYRDWEILTPTHSHPDLKNTADLNYVAIKTKEIGLLGSSRHVWMELISSEGEGYSVGLCGSTKFPYNAKEGKLISPDPKEAAAGKERKVLIELTTEQFNRLKGRIETDKREKKEYFHIFYHNCSRYTVKVLDEELGVKINNKEFFTQALFRKFLEKTHLKVPQPVLKVISYVANFFRFALSGLYHLVYLCTGAWHTSKKLRPLEAKCLNPEQSPKGIKSFFKHLFLLDHMRVCTGWKVSVWQDAIKNKFGSRSITIEEANKIYFPTGQTAVVH
jgi:hypothetical protein